MLRRAAMRRPLILFSRRCCDIRAMYLNVEDLASLTGVEIICIACVFMYILFYDDHFSSWENAILMIGWSLEHNQVEFFLLLVAMRPTLRLAYCKRLYSILYSRQHPLKFRLSISTMGVQRESISCTITVLPRTPYHISHHVVVSRWCATSFRPRCAMTRGFEVISVCGVWMFGRSYMQLSLIHMSFQIWQRLGIKPIYCSSNAYVPKTLIINSKLYWFRL